jgi:preprotein translocase subunit SecD
MAKNSKNKKITVSRRAIAALTLAVALVLTIIFVVLGVTGRKMDTQGLFKLLPWLPTTGETYDWRQALVPGAGLGDTKVTTLGAVTEGDAAQEELQNAVKVLVKRLSDFGWTDAAVEISGGKLVVTLPEGADTQYLNSILTAKGEFTFSDPAGEVFMDNTNVTSAGFGYADQSGTNFALSLAFDAEGKEAFGQKSTELSGQSITLRRDGLTVVSPSISDPITEGSVSIPGFTLEAARENAVLLRSGPLPFTLSSEAEGTTGSALLGNNAQNTLIIALLCAFALIALYFLVSYRLGGFLAAWMLLLQLAFSYFFAALIGAGFTVLTLSAIYAAFLVTVFTILSLFSSVRQDVKRGRSMRQSLKESYATHGHASLDVFVGLLLISVVMIIMDKGIIKDFSEIFAISLLLGLLITHLVFRLLLNETVHLFGGKASLYAANSTEKKEG